MAPRKTPISQRSSKLASRFALGRNAMISPKCGSTLRKALPLRLSRGVRPSAPISPRLMHPAAWATSQVNTGWSFG
eukprot:5183195-Pyramimonas_sp.AAC.1